MLSVFCDIYWIGTKLCVLFPFFLPFHLFPFQKGCVCMCVCARVCEHVVCAYTVFQPCGHASGTSTYYICHCLYHVTSIFCKLVSLLCLEGQTLLPRSLLFPSVSVTPFPLPSLSACQPVFCQPSPHFSSSLSLTALK